jgi:arginyl-tRNA synthetase
MNLFEYLRDVLHNALTAASTSFQNPLPENAADRFTVEPPREESHGDAATNLAMVLAKDVGLNPRALAEAVLPHLQAHEDIQEASLAGPGFINIRVKPQVFHRVLHAALAKPETFGRATFGAGQKLNVEYVSANPTGPMHVGHGRGAVFGDALCALLKAVGYSVIREYYINDAGAQVEVLARSSYLRYKEALGETIEIPEGLYPGDYLKAVGAQLARDHGRDLLNVSEKIWLPIVQEASITAMMAMIREDLAALNVRHDVFFSEALLSRDPDQIAATLQDLRGRGLIYEGRLPPPKGQLPDDWEDREQTLFRATEYGDDVDRPLLKSDGRYTYFAADIAYHRSKFLRGFTQLIDVWGADHGGYVKRMQAATTAVSGGKASLTVKLCQMVRLLRDGEPVKMSKRSGTFVTLREVVDEVGRDAVRFMMVMRKNDAPLDFDLTKVREQSKDNPVFYVQYAFARCCSVFRQAEAAGISVQDLATAPLDALDDALEGGLVRMIAQYPRVIETAARAYEPHRVAFYLYDLSSAFHSLWNKGKESPAARFVNVEALEKTRARLALLKALQTVLVSGLDLLGVTAPQDMR